MSSRPGPDVVEPGDELFRLLETPEMQAKMRAVEVGGQDVGFPEHPHEPHDRLWALILEARPDWRPWYEAAKEEARRAFAFYRAGHGPDDLEEAIAERTAASPGYPDILAAAEAARGRPEHAGLRVIHAALTAALHCTLPEEVDDLVRDALDALTGFCSSSQSVPALTGGHPCPTSVLAAFGPHAPDLAVERVMRESGLPEDEVRAGSDVGTKPEGERWWLG